MQEYFYDFTIEGKNRGHSYLYIDSASLRSVTRFVADKDSLVTNVFLLKIKGRGDFSFADKR